MNVRCSSDGEWEIEEFSLFASLKKMMAMSVRAKEKILDNRYNYFVLACCRVTENGDDDGINDTVTGPGVLSEQGVIS